MSPLSSTDPDTIKYPPGDKPTLILSVSDTTLTLGNQLGAPVDLYVESFRVEENEYTVNRDPICLVRFGLFTGRFNAALPNKTTRWTVSINGAPGDKSTVDDAAKVTTSISEKATKSPKVPVVGPNGCGGGAIDFYVEDVDASTIKSIIFEASGGHGYSPEQSGSSNSLPAGKGGNGGDGGQIKILLSHNSVAAAVEQTKQLQKDTLHSARVWPVDFKASTTTLIALIRSQTQILSTNALDYTLRVLEKSLKGSLSDFQDALRNLRLALQNVVEYLESLFYQSVRIDGGDCGKGSTGEKDGSPGKRGRFSIQTTLSARKVWESEVCFTHPVQCHMLLEKAKMYFFVDQAEALANSKEILERLSHRLEFLDHAPKTGVESTKLAKAYRAAERRLYLPITPTNQPSLVFQMLRAIKDEAAATLSVLISGQDFYGKDRFYAPRLSFTYYKGVVAEFLGYLRQIEAAYIKYKNAADDITTKRTHISKGLDACRRAKVYNSQLYKSAVEELHQYDIKIRSLAQPIKTAKDELNRLVEVVKGEIKAAFKIPFQDIVAAMGLVLMVQGKGMIGLQGLSLLEQANVSISADDGTKIKKEYLIRRVENIKGTIDSLMEGYRVGKNGMLSPDDPGAAKLQISQKDLNILLNSYWDTLTSATLNAVKKEFQNYITLVLDRNAAIFRYNVALSLMAKYKAEQRSLEATIESLGQQNLTELDLHSPLMATVMKKAYIDMVMTTQHWLYLAQRAYNFVALNSYDIIGSALKGARVSRYDYTLLLTAQASLVAAYTGSLEKEGKDPQPFQITYHLDNTYKTMVRNSGKNGKLLIVHLSPKQSGGHDDDDDDDNNGPSSLNKDNEAKAFANRADIRLTNVRLFLPGAKATKKLRILLTHTGTETFTTVGGRNIMFTHDMLEVECVYDTESRKCTGGDLQDPGDNKYALVGPFTSWKIWIDPNLNDGLDLGNVSDVYMEFCGVCHPTA